MMLQLRLWVARLLRLVLMVVMMVVLGTMIARVLDLVLSFRRPKLVLRKLQISIGIGLVSHMYFT